MKLLKTQILQLENDLLRPEIRQSAEKTSELLATYRLIKHSLQSRSKEVLNKCKNQHLFKTEPN